MLSNAYADWLVHLPLARLPQLKHHSAWEQLHVLDILIPVYTSIASLKVDIPQKMVGILQQTGFPNLETIAITIRFDGMGECNALLADADGPQLCGDLEKAISWVRRQAIMVTSSRGIQATRKPLWLSRAASLFPAMQARNSLFIKGPWSA